MRKTGRKAEHYSAYTDLASNVMKTEEEEFVMGEGVHRG